MRIFIIVFGLLFLIGGVAVGGLYFRDAVSVAYAAYELKNELTSLQKTINATPNDTDCVNPVTQTRNITGAQLRFESEISYVVERVCQESHINKPLIYRKTLFGGVQRIYGSGVSISSDEEKSDREAWIMLGKGNTRVSVGLLQGDAKIIWNNKDLNYGGLNSAGATCKEWGFSCCRPDKEIGEGEQIVTLDCVNSCFQRCNQYPQIQYFNSLPYMNQKTRSVTLDAYTSSVDFAYHVTDELPLNDISIEFGDGEIARDLPEQSQGISHEYQCQQVRCEYTALLKARDVDGHTSIENEQSRIKIVIQP